MASTTIRWKRIAFWVGAAVVIIQFVPYGRDHSNPPVTGHPDWDSADTQDTFYQVCGDCHSNRTRWPWYSHVAPVSWLVQHDVQGGRGHLNVSEWGRGHNHGDEAADMVQGGEMPPWYYLPAHPQARLSQERKRALIRGLTATFGTGSAETHSHQKGDAHEIDHDHDEGQNQEGQGEHHHD